MTKQPSGSVMNGKSLKCGKLFNNENSAYDELAQLAASICQTPVCWIACFDGEFHHITSYVGDPPIKDIVGYSVLAQVMHSSEKACFVEDLWEDDRFQSDAFVRDYSEHRFFAGLPIGSEKGSPLGAICVMDYQPRKLTETQLQGLVMVRNQLARLAKLDEVAAQHAELTKSHKLLRDRNRKLIENTDGIFWEADAQTFEFHYVSPQVERYLGFTPEEWLNTPNFWQDHIHPEDRAYAINTCHTETTLLKDHSFDYRMRMKSGEYIWMHDKVTVYEKNGKPDMLSGILIDISTQKKLELALKEKINLLHTLIEDLPLPFFLFDEAGNNLLVNKAMLSYSEYSEAEYKKLTPIDLFEGDQKAIARKNIAIALEKGEAMAEATITSKSGKKIEFLFRGAVVNYEGKKCVLGVGMDISATKRAERALAASEKRFRAIVQEGGDIITVIDDEGNFNFIGSTSLNILGWDPDHMLGKNAFDFIHPKDAPQVRKELQQLRSTRRTELSPYRFLDITGGWRWLETILTNFSDEETLHGILATSRDVTKQREIQFKLEQSEARYRLFFESQTNYVVRTDLDGTYTYANSKFMQDFGWVYSHEVIGKNSLKSICKHHHDRVKDLVRKCLETPGKAFQVELDKPSTASGEVLTTIWDFMCLLDEDNQPSEIQCSGINVTDRIRAERQVKETNERYELLSDASSEVIYELDPTSGSLFLGKNFERIYGIPLDGQTTTIDWFNAHILPADKDLAINALKKAMGNPTTSTWHHRYRLRNGFGQPVWVEDSGVIVRDESSRASRIVGSIKDVSEIQQIKELMDSASELSRVGGWEINVIQNSIHWTPTTCDIFGVPHDYKQTLEESVNFYREDFREELRKLVAKGKSENKSDMLEAIIITRDGQERWVRSIGKSEFVDGRCVRIYGSIQDIHDKKLAEQQLRRINEELHKSVRDLALSNQELEQFAYVASHDLQEPLRMISSFMGLLDKKYHDKLDEKARQYIYFAKDGAARMKNIIIDLLEFSRVGRNAGDLEELSVTELIKRIIKPLEPKLKLLGGRIMVGTMPQLYTYQTPLTQIFQNLIENAVKYRRPELAPVIQINASERKNHWEFSVSDNGLGISKAYFDKIFILFQRLHNKNEYSGNGIGLAIVKKSVEFLGGQIWVESEEGKGSTFFFTVRKNAKQNS